MHHILPLARRNCTRCLLVHIIPRHETLAKLVEDRCDFCFKVWVEIGGVHFVLLEPGCNLRVVGPAIGIDLIAALISATINNHNISINAVSTQVARQSG